MSSRQTSAVVLVTGAAGKTGRAILRALGASRFTVRALVRSPEQRSAVEALGVDRVHEGDLLDDSAVLGAMRSVDAVYHICPNVHPRETEIGLRVLAAARESRVGRFVFHSVLHPQAEAMPHHWAKLRVEESLFESGVPFTILQPAPYMQNILSQWQHIRDEGTYKIPYSSSTRVAMVDLDEVARVAASVLGDSRHAGATYELCGPDLLDQAEIADHLGRHFGRPVRAETVTLEAWAQSASCLPGSYRFETLAKMFHYYEHHGMAGNPRVLGTLLDRPPTGFADFVARQEH